MSYSSYAREVAEDNRAIAEGMRRYPNRIIGFGGVSPNLGKRKATYELKCCIYYGKIAEEGLVLALHCVMNDLVRTHPW